MPYWIFISYLLVLSISNWEDGWGFVGIVVTLTLAVAASIYRLMKWNSNIYKHHIGIYPTDIYARSFDGKREVSIDRMPYVLTILRLLKMRQNGVWFVGLLTTPVYLMITSTLRDVEITRGMVLDDLSFVQRKPNEDGFLLIPMDDPYEEFYEANKKHFAPFNKLFPILYFLVHWSNTKPAWLMKDEQQNP